MPTRLLLAHALALTRVTPVFPQETLDARVDGSVIVALEIDHEGAVTQTLQTEVALPLGRECPTPVAL